MLGAWEGIFMNCSFKHQPCGQVLAGVVLVVLLCGSVQNTVAQAPTEEPVVICLTKSGLKHYVQPRDAMEVYHALVEEYMIPRLGFPIEFRFYENDRELYRNFSQGTADIACSHLVGFLKEYDRGLVKPIVWFKQQRKTSGINGDRYIMIVRKKMGLQRLGQLKGKVLGISHVQDRNKIRHLFFKEQKHFKEDLYFGKVKTYESSRDAIYSLFFNVTDVVFDTEYSLETFKRLRPELSDSIETLCVDPTVIADLPIFYRTSADEKKQEKIEQIGKFFQSMHEDPGLQQMLLFLGCDSAQPVTGKEEAGYRLWIKKYRDMGLIPRSRKAKHE
jgi:ABC-type phosphate/phosphonate transport system substrate-binding protein